MAKKATQSTPSTQKHLEIAEIKEDTVVMKDGTLRGVMLVSSINFALKAEEEQEALISSYMDFINSFQYPFQIVIQSRKLSMEKYLNKLGELEKEQQNELLKSQMSSYREYIKELVELGDIMTKSFYVVLPYSPLESERKSFWTKVKEVFTPGTVIKLSQKKFNDYKRELDIRMGQISGSLQSMGLNAVRLDTQSLIELYYNVYNPRTSAMQPLEDLRKIRVEQEF